MRKHWREKTKEREMQLENNFKKKPKQQPQTVISTFNWSLFIIECNSAGYTNFNADHQHLWWQTLNMAETDADLQHQRLKQYVPEAGDSLKSYIGEHPS